MPDLRHALFVRRLDRVLIAAALVLVAAIAVDALHKHGGGSGSKSATPAPAPVTTASTTSPSSAAPASTPGEAPVPRLVRLIPSSTAFLPQCPTRSLTLSIVRGPALQLRFVGSRCHVPPLHLHAAVRDANGRLVYTGPALAHEDLSGNFAGEAVVRAPLLVGCRSIPLYATVSGSGLSADGPVRCG